MKHIVHRPYWNWEKEEKWLNEMSARGLAMSDYSWCRYVFEEAPPGEYVYRIELLDNSAGSPAVQKYIRFVEETGAECVAAYMRWVYFRKKAADGPFALHSGISSQMAHNKKVRAFWLFFAVLELGIGLLNICVGIAAPFAPLNLILGVLLAVLSAVFFFWAAQITHKVRRLKKELLIHDS